MSVATKSLLTRETSAATPWWLVLIVRVVFFAALIAVWQLWASRDPEKAYLHPGPLDVLKSFRQISDDGTLFLSIRASMGRMLVGYSISVVGGILLGALTARSWLMKQTLGTLILSIQSLPSICWLPFALIFVGINEWAILAVLILGAMFSIAVSTENAIRNIPPIYVKVGRTLGARNLTLLKDILFFAALPELIGGLKVGWTFAWRSLMAAELIRQDVTGVARLLDTGRQYNDIAMMMAAIFTILAIGLFVDLVVFGRLEKAVRRRYGLEK